MQATSERPTAHNTSDEELRKLILRFIQLIAAEVAQRILSDKMLQTKEKDTYPDQFGSLLK